MRHGASARVAMRAHLVRAQQADYCPPRELVRRGHELSELSNVIIAPFCSRFIAHVRKVQRSDVIVSVLCIRPAKSLDDVVTEHGHFTRRLNDALRTDALLHLNAVG